MLIISKVVNVYVDDFLEVPEREALSNHIEEYLDMELTDMMEAVYNVVGVTGVEVK